MSLIAYILILMFYLGQEGDWIRCNKHDCKTLKRYPVTEIHLLSQFIRKQGTQDDEDCFPTTVDQLESHHDKLSDTMRAKLETVKSRIEEDVRTEPISSARFFKMFGAHTCNSFVMLNNNLAGIAVGIYLRWLRLLYRVSQKKVYT